MSTREAAPPQRPGEIRDGDPRSTGWVEVAIVAAIGLVLLLVFLLPVLFHDHAFPVGPDVPVYLWWGRVAAADGVSLVGARPGAPVLLATLSSALGQGPVATLAGVQYVTGPAIGLAAVALLRTRADRGRLTWVAGGIFAGVWATHLGDGYLANLVFSACFLAAGATLAGRSSAGAVAAALLLGGGGLAHPSFFVVGALVLMLTAAWSVWDDRGFSWRGDAGRIALAVAGGGAILGVGLLAALAGPARLAGDTSKDAYLRRIGAVETLRRTYLERFRQGWTRYAPWVTLPLAIAGALRGNGPVRRFLLSWAAFTVAAFAIVLVTRSIPPDRLLTFAFCVPLLAALGFVWVGDLVRRRTGRRSVAAAALALIAILAVFPALRAWISSPDFVDASEMRNAIVAGRVASLTPPGTPLVFVANDLDSNGLFHMAHVFNVARAAVPVDRVSDVHVFVGSARDLLAGRPTVRGVPNHDAASARTFEELPAGPWAVFVVDGLDDDASELDLPGLTRWDEAVASTVPPTSVPLPPPGADEPAPSTPGAMALAAVRTLIVLVLVGFGWGWWVTGETAGAAALATSFGLAVITIRAHLADRLGAPIATAGWATIAIASAGGCGYALMIVRLRRARRSPDGDGLVRERGSGA